MRRPAIVVNKRDHPRLLQLANGLVSRNPDLAEELLTELERARVLERGEALRETVQMGSSLEYRTEEGQTRRLTLVYPADADIAQGKISILTPVGTALLGLRAGQSMEWVANDGRPHRLTILSVEPGMVDAAQ